MATELKTLLAELEDPRLYVKVPDRVLFDVHAEPILEVERDKDGKPVIDQKTGQPKLRQVGKRVFNEPALRYIAGKTNARDAAGVLCPLTLGHSVPGAGNEAAQPDITGYARNFRTRFHKPLNRHVIAADYYIRRDQLEEAKKFPHTSVELWPPEKGDEEDGWFFHPVALIKRTPRRPVGQWVYHRPNGRQVIRYSMEDSNMPEGDAGMGGTSFAEAGQPDEASQAEAYMKHCYSHPYARGYAESMCKKYGAAEASPTEPPDFNKPGEPPLAVPPVAETGVSNPEKEKAPPPATSAPPLETQGGDTYARSQAAQQYARQQQATMDAVVKQVQALTQCVNGISQERAKEKAEIQALRYERDQVKWGGLLAEQVRQGVQMDSAKELAHLMKLPTDEARAEHLERISLHYSRSPVGNLFDGLPPLSVASAGVSHDARPEFDPKTGYVSPKKQAEAIQYQRQHGWCSWSEAVKAVTDGKMILSEPTWGN